MKRIALLLSLTLLGCNNPLEKELEKINQHEAIESEETESEVNELVEFYDRIPHNNESLVQDQLRELSISDDHTTPENFAAYVGDVLFDFYNRDLEPLKYIDFLYQHGSFRFQNDMLSGSKVEDIWMAKSVQQLLEDRKVKYLSMTLSELTQTSSGDWYYYRKLERTDGQIEYYQTKIRKEDGLWKFESDEPSHPFELLSSPIEEVKNLVEEDIEHEIEEEETNE